MQIIEHDGANYVNTRADIPTGEEEDGDDAELPP